MPALGTGAARVSIEQCANAMTNTLRWHPMLGGMRCSQVTVWLDSEAKRRLYQDVAEETFGIGDIGLLRSVDLGLPVDPKATQPTPDGATFLDRRVAEGTASTDRSLKRWRAALVLDAHPKFLSYAERPWRRRSTAQRSATSRSGCRGSRPITSTSFGSSRSAKVNG